MSRLFLNCLLSRCFSQIPEELSFSLVSFFFLSPATFFPFHTPFPSSTPFPQQHSFPQQQSVRSPSSTPEPQISRFVVLVSRFLLLCYYFFWFILISFIYLILILSLSTERGLHALIARSSARTSFRSFICARYILFGASPSFVSSTTFGDLKFCT